MCFLVILIIVIAQLVLAGATGNSDASDWAS